MAMFFFWLLLSYCYNWVLWQFSPKFEAVMSAAWRSLLSTNCLNGSWVQYSIIFIPCIIQCNWSVTVFCPGVSRDSLGFVRISGSPATVIGP